MTSATERADITVRLHQWDPQVAVHLIEGLVDMALASLGATIETIEMAGLGVAELCDAVSADGRITEVSMLSAAAGPVFRVHHDAGVVRFEPGAREIVEAAFGDVVTRDDCIELHPTAPPGGGAHG